VSRQWNYDRELCSWKTEDYFISVPHMRKVKPVCLGADMRDCGLGADEQTHLQRTDSYTLRERDRLGHKFRPAACLPCLAVHMRIAAMATDLYWLQGIGKFRRYQ